MATPPAIQQPIRKKMKRKENEEETERKEFFLHAAMRLERDWLWRCLINQQWNYSRSLFHSPLQHSSTTTIASSRPGNWERKADQSWNSCVCECVRECVSSWQLVLSCGHARLRACLQESFIIQWLIPYSSQIAWSQHQSLRLLRATAQRFLTV